ncbi:NEAT domain-containing protein [Paenibacillus sp. IITD108]|uniref:NEAT domain-containing protein n=1 Tax=Paenibacillus sp. IITD108 TaxID=3116649 RepID=UPI002F40265F
MSVRARKPANVILAAVICLIAAAVLFTKVEAASDLKDGSYLIDYTVLQADSDSVSIANDYFQKKAALFVKGGKKYIELNVTHSEWVKTLQAADGEAFTDVVIISEDRENDSRLVTFKAGDNLAEPVLMQMHIQIDSLNYNHKYTVKFQFDSSTIEAADLTQSISSLSKPPGSTNYTAMALAAVVGVVVIAAVMIVLRKRRTGN